MEARRLFLLLPQLPWQRRRRNPGLFPLLLLLLPLLLLPPLLLPEGTISRR